MEAAGLPQIGRGIWWAALSANDGAAFGKPFTSRSRDRSMTLDGCRSETWSAIREQRLRGPRHLGVVEFSQQF
jgi:hypothetical protein